MKGVVALLLLGIAVAAPVNQDSQNELPGENSRTRPHPTGLPTISFSLPPLPTWSIPPLPTGSGFPGFPRPTGEPGGPGAALIPPVDPSLPADLTPQVVLADLPPSVSLKSQFIQLHNRELSSNLRTAPLPTPTPTP
ncbi:hypothetical protein Daesc_007298 [Daldinia eschscholtzii]|uniref:Uncharacterized protein n=1 Tax=Daldinia eschscholtzii TaxID=292717 RepID=A0AAX6MEA3_9PEZI